MSNHSTEREVNCELNIWFCEQLELAHTTSPMDKAISDSAVGWTRGFVSTRQTNKPETNGTMV